MSGPRYLMRSYQILAVMLGRIIMPNWANDDRVVPLMLNFLLATFLIKLVPS